jgi:hypothetical protein
MSKYQQIARWCATAAAVGMCACTMFGQTPYQPYSAWGGGGYSETEVQPGLFLVRFIGNESTSTGRAADFALLRAADICLQRGKGYLRVGGLATKAVQSGYIPGATTSTVTPTGPDSPPVVTVDTLPPTILHSPESGIAISCTEMNQEGAWDATYLARAIRTRYSIS